MNRLSPVNPTCTSISSCLALILLAAGLVSCKPVSERMEITETRNISEYAAPAQANVSDFTRFHIQPPAPPRPPQIDFVWDTPMGWKEAPPDAAGMRMINLAFGPNGEGECYLSMMPGGAGGVEANINRWRKQMGQPDMSAEEIAKLPTKKLFGRDTTFVSLEGDFQGMGAAESQKNYRMLGLVQPTPQVTLFVKMTGPKDLVAANEAAFDQFCQSIDIKR
jgi:hypothetical protein